MREIFIYTLADRRTPDNIRYIGKALDPHDRAKRHLQPYYLKEKNYKSRWINKLLKEGSTIIMEVLDVVNESEWQFWETHWIGQLKAWGYSLTNTTLGGEGLLLTPDVLKRRNASNIGRVVSPETREKIRVSQLGKVISEEHKQRLREVNTGKKYSDETKSKLSKMRKGEGNSFFGKTHDEDSLNKMVMNHPFRRSIGQHDLNGTLIQTFVSSHEAEEKTCITRSTISRACKTEKPSKGFIWKYV